MGRQRATRKKARQAKAMNKLQDMTHEELLQVVQEITTIKVEDDNGELLEEINYPESKQIIQTAVRAMFTRQPF